MGVTYLKYDRINFCYACHDFVLSLSRTFLFGTDTVTEDGERSTKKQQYKELETTNAHKKKGECKYN